MKKVQAADLLSILKGKKKVVGSGMEEEFPPLSASPKPPPSLSPLPPQALSATSFTMMPNTPSLSGILPDIPDSTISPTESKDSKIDVDEDEDRDDFGMQGLLDAIKRVPADRNYWYVGAELESLGMVLDETPSSADATSGNQTSDIAVENNNDQCVEEEFVKPWNVFQGDLREVPWETVQEMHKLFASPEYSGVASPSVQGVLGAAFASRLKGSNTSQSKSLLEDNDNKGDDDTQSIEDTGLFSDETLLWLHGFHEAMREQMRKVKLRRSFLHPTTHYAYVPGQDASTQHHESFLATCQAL